MNEDTYLCAGIVIGLLIGLSVALAVWVNSHDSAVVAGHAEFYLDADHERQWRWKTNCTHDL